MRKKTHAFVANENPNARLMYRSSEGFFCWTVVTTIVPIFVFDEMFATLYMVASQWCHSSMALRIARQLQRLDRGEAKVVAPAIGI